MGVTVPLLRPIGRLKLLIRLGFRRQANRLNRLEYIDRSIENTWLNIHDRSMPFERSPDRVALFRLFALHRPFNKAAIDEAYDNEVDSDYRQIRYRNDFDFMQQFHFMVKQIAKRFQGHEIGRAEQVSFTCFSQLVVKAVKCIEKREKRVFVRFKAMSRVSPEESVGGCIYGLHKIIRLLAA